MNEELRGLKQELRRKELQIKELRVLVTKDPLTGLYNRRGFEEEVLRLIKDIIYSKENPEAREHFYIDSISILFFDIDNFKKLNDQHGHKAGDQVLRQVSQIIRQKIRSIDFTARWGGEELIVALVGSHESDAFRKAEEIRKAIKSRVRAGDLSAAKAGKTITVSIGVAELKDELIFEDLIKRADKAMYIAKHKRGKDNTVRYSEISNL